MTKITKSTHAVAVKSIDESHCKVAAQAATVPFGIEEGTSACSGGVNGDRIVCRGGMSASASVLVSAALLSSTPFKCLGGHKGVHNFVVGLLDVHIPIGVSPRGALIIQCGFTSKSLWILQVVSL